MSEAGNYITIKQFAEMVNVSPQAIYKQLNGKLKKYFKVVDNQKFISLEALAEFQSKEPIQQNQQLFNNQIEKNFNQILMEKDNQISELKNQIKMLQDLLSTANVEKERLITLLQQQQEAITLRLPQPKKSILNRIFGKKEDTK